MAFVCVSIRRNAQLLKSWYGRTIYDKTMTLADLYYKFASGEFDQRESIDIQTAQVRNIYNIQ